MKRFTLGLAMFLVITAADDSCTPTSDDKQQAQQEKILDEGTSQVGMPAIKNFYERKQLKHIIELRDQEGLITYTYQQAEMTGKLVFLCNSTGYGIPAATQFTNPMKWAHQGVILPQADPNGLFSPPTAEGTWIICLGPDKQAHVGYSEPRITVSPFKLAE